MHIEELIEKEVEKNKELPSEKKSALRENLRKVFLENAPLNTLFDISEGEMERIYAEAYTLYTYGKLKESKDLFQFLTLVDPLQPRNYIGLGVCFEVEKNYEKAIDSYYGWAKVELSPLPYYHLAECYLHLEDKESAAFALAHSLLIAGNNPYYSELKERAELMLKAITKEV